jgi:flagellar basal body P-ring formation protein FlgA
MTRKFILCVGFTALLASSSALAESPLHAVSELQHWAETFTRQQLQLPTDSNLIVRVTAGPLDPRLRLQRCAVDLTGIMPGTRTSARVTVGVRCTSPAWTVYVPVTIESEMNVLVLREAVARNSSLTANDVELQPRRVPGIGSSYLTSTTQLRGRHLKQGAGPGTPLTTELLTADVLIKRGQRVTLVADAGGIEVRALAVCGC